MTEILRDEWRTARKEHTCSYCGKQIDPNEKYHYHVMKYDGQVYDWKAHEQCEFVAQEIWDYCEPDEGLTEEEFQDGCREICRDFVCPDCEKHDDCDEDFCFFKVYALLMKYELYRDRSKGYFDGWKIRERSSLFSAD